VTTTTNLFGKGLSVIFSCKTDEQLQSALKYIGLAFKAGRLSKDDYWALDFLVEQKMGPPLKAVFGIDND